MSDLDHTCPYCETVNDAADHVDNDGIHPDTKPEANDMTMCITCGRFSRLDDDLIPRALTGDETQELMRDPVAQTIRLAWEETRLRMS